MTEKDITPELERAFEEMWKIQGAHNLSLQKNVPDSNISNIDWKFLCHEFFMQGALAVVKEMKINQSWRAEVRTRIERRGG